MPQALNAIQGEQWDNCDQCGFLYPMSRLTKQKGLLVCVTRHCFENLEVERREYVIEAILGSGNDQEGVDQRTVDRGFFEGYDEVTR